MNQLEARSLLTAFARSRDEWLTKTTATLDAGGLWLIGSLATGYPAAALVRRHLTVVNAFRSSRD